MMSDADDNVDGNSVEEQPAIQFVHKSPVLSTALHGMSELINTRLSKEELDLCLELIESGVHPKALAEAVLHILDVKSKRDSDLGQINISHKDV